MSYLAAILVLHLEEELAFTALCHLVREEPFSSFLRMDTAQGFAGVEAHCQIFLELLEDTCPDIFLCFSENEITPQMYLVDWYMTAFSRPLPLDIVARIWDRLVLDQYRFLCRAALGTLLFAPRSICRSLGYVFLTV